MSSHHLSIIRALVSRDVGVSWLATADTAGVLTTSATADDKVLDRPVFYKIVIDASWPM